jgi:hypothetical protein
MAIPAVLMGSACSRGEQYELQTPIAMGPWTFEVESIGARVRTDRGGDRRKTVIAVFKLHNFEERYEKTFDDFLNGTSPGALMARPRTRLEDQSGSKFDGWLEPVSGGRLRSERWRAEFLLVDLGIRDVMRSTQDLAAQHVDRPLADFRLVIDNPDPRPGQPRGIFILLQ